MSDKLNGKEKMDIVIESSLQLVPYVGGALATAYYGTKNEKRFKRIEAFYADIKTLVEANEEKFIALSSSYNEDEIIDLIEKLNDKVEKEHQQKKIEYFKNYFLNTVFAGKNKSFDEKSFFLDSLANMTLIECDMLQLVNKAMNINHGIQVKSLNYPGLDQYALVGAVGRLKNLGFIRAQTMSLQIGGTNSDNSLNEVISLTPFGRSFIEYCFSRF